MDEITDKRFVSTQEMACTLQVGESTIKRAVEKLADLLQPVAKNNQGGYLFNENQASLIKREIQQHHNLQSRKIDNVHCYSDDLSIFLEGMNAFYRIINNDYNKNFEYENVDKSGFVYIAKQLNEDNLYKIGHTKDISNRLSTFKVGNCFVEMIASKYVNNANNFETFLHKLLVEKRFKYEWFLLNYDELQNLINIFNFNMHIKEY